MRNLKALGLALVAALAISAMAASAAQATPNPTITPTEGPTTLHGFQLPNGGPNTINSLTLPGLGLQVNCATTTLDAWGVLAGPQPEVQFTPTYGGCQTNTGLWATVTHNECRKRFYHFTTVPGTAHYTSTAELFCPTGRQIEIHLYADAQHLNQVCTVYIPPQTFQQGAFTVTNEPNFNPTTNSLVIEGTVGGLKYTVTGGGVGPCAGHQTYFDGVTHTTVTVTGKDHAGFHRGIHIF